MKQLLILSGKGGTGKTTVAGAFIRLSQAKAYADCDVDAPNLHLVMNSSSEAKRRDYFGLPKACIDPALCAQCGSCAQYCRFEAIISDDGYSIDPFACEGCGVCEAVCPQKAISLKDAVAGGLKLYTGDAVFSTAELKMGSGTSGLLVTEVKKQLISEAKDREYAVIDGSPGIGCPVIASISGAHLVLIVAEPSVSGISDMERIIKTANSFHVKTAVCVNKYDTNAELSGKIEQYCKDRGIPFTGRIPFDSEAVKAINRGVSIADVDCASGRAVRTVYENTMKLLALNFGYSIFTKGESK